MQRKRREPGNSPAGSFVFLIFRYIMRRMKWNFAAAILPLLLIQQLFSFAPAAPIRGQDSAPVQDTTVQDTTVCELTAHPGQFDGKMVRVKVQVIAPFK